MNFRIGLIGVGNMGYPLLKHILNANSKKVNLFLEKHMYTSFKNKFNNVSLYKNPDINEFVSNSDLVVSILPNSYITLNLIQSIPSTENKKYWLDLTSSCPKDVSTMNAILNRKNIMYMDAPVSGGPAGIKNKTVSTILSGPKEIQRYTKDFIQLYAKNIYYLSEIPGQASHVKLANNTLLALHLITNAEVFKILKHNNICLEKALEFINTSSGRNWASMQRYPDHILPETFDYGFSYPLHKKDVLTFLNDENTRNTFFLQTLQNIYQDPSNLLHDSMDHTEIIKIIK